MVEPVTILTGLALVKKSVDFVKQQIETCNDIGDIIGHIDKAMTGEQQCIKARDKSGADPFAIGTVAQEIIDVKIARENLNELRNLVNLRFGHGTWEFILQERKRRIDAQKQAIKEEKARRLKKRQEIEEYIKYGFITLAVILFLGVAIGVTFKFFVSVSDPVYAHDMEYDDESCLVYTPKWWLICLNEGRERADTELYLEYKRQQNNWIIEKD
tara:strand:+ start:7458 stop:8099 length:642 start_codon:yes stop_codon:yes gene_type:complete